MAGKWHETTIGELCAAGVADLQTGPFGSQLHAYDYVEEGVAVVPTEAIGQRRVDHTVLPKISSSKAEELARHRLEPGDILFARRGVQAAGRIALVREAERGFLCGTGAIRLRITRGDPTVSAEFLSHILADGASVEWFKFHAIGATMPNLNEGIIRSFPLSLPPEGDQRAIAHILGTLDDKIELNRRMSETLESFAHAIFQSWFVDFDPVRAKAEGRDTGLPTRLADLFPHRFEDSELGEIPAGWEVKSVGEMADIVGGSTPRTDEPAFWDDGMHHWATPKDLSGLRVPVLLDTERRISDIGLAQISSGLLPAGTVLLSSRAPIGYLAIAEVPLAINQGFIAMKPRRGVPNQFLLLWAASAHDEILSRANGSTFLEISKSNFRPIRMVLPPGSTLAAFGELSQPVYKAMASCARESRMLANLRDVLLPLLISGELRVGEREAAA